MTFMRTVVTDTLRKEWNGDTRTYTQWDLAGNLVGSRPFTDSENALADAVDAKELESVNRPSVESKASDALTVNSAFLDIALQDMTQADIVKQVRALTRQNNALIRLVLGNFSDISDT